MYDWLLWLLWLLFGAGIGTGIAVLLGARYCRRAQDNWNETFERQAEDIEMLRYTIREACYCLDRNDVSKRRVKEFLRGALP